jgi:RND superfamily putative drug exporter
METSYDFIGSMGESESKAGLDAMGEGFGEGRVNPTQVALLMSGPVVDNGTFRVSSLSSIEKISTQISALEYVKQVTGPTRPNGVIIDYQNTTVLDQYQSTIQHMIGSDNRSVLLTVIFTTEPFARESINTIHELRDVAADAPADPNIDQMMVGGATATMFDIADMVWTDFGQMEYLVVIGIYVVLLLVLASVFSPLKSILTILLSISWTLALTLLIFQVYLGQPVLYLVPMILLVVCLGLGMDYDILLITRMREEVVKGMSNHDAIVHAVEKTGAIITACGVIMASAFGSMMLSNGYLLKQFGFALMFAILLDATIVRIYLVPAIMSLMGHWNWWAPGPIRRMNERRDRKRLRELKEAEESLQRDEDDIAR